MGQVFYLNSLLVPLSFSRLVYAKEQRPGCSGLKQQSSVMFQGLHQECR